MRLLISFPKHCWRLQWNISTAAVKQIKNNAIVKNEWTKNLIFLRLENYFANNYTLHINIDLRISQKTQKKSTILIFLFFEIIFYKKNNIVKLIVRNVRFLMRLHKGIQRWAFQLVNNSIVDCKHIFGSSLYKYCWTQYGRQAFQNMSCASVSNVSCSQSFPGCAGHVLEKYEKQIVFAPIKGVTENEKKKKLNLKYS